MKPLRLTLDAVGPYPGRQVIDFRTALESRLFGIYGPTGAGKSTIFSAMTFALFGEAAKAEQHASTLRSDHADPTHMTTVEFIFETHGRAYRIVRNPEQMRPAKRGSGETKEGHKATLFDVTGLDLATVCDALPGKVVAEGKVDVVNKEIIRLLGYGPAQFRQIVLLPQGRFENFLAVNTQERVKILRDLFDVSLYRRLAEKVKANADTAEARVKTARDVCAGRLSAEGFATRDELAVGIGKAQTDLVLHRDAAVAAKTALDTATQAYQTAALTDRAFTEHVEADKALKAVEAETDAVNGFRDRISRARTAQLLSEAELSVNAARKAVDDMTLQASAAARAQEEAETQARTAAERLKVLTDKTAEQDRDKADLQDCEAHAKRLEASAVLQEAATKAAAKALADKRRATQSKSHHEDNTRSLEALVQQVESARSATVRRAALRSQQVEAGQALQSAKLYERAQSQLATDRQSLERLDAQVGTALAQLTVREAAFNEAEAALLRNHALHVAAHLVDGKPCPACGSREHPAPAHGSAQEGAVAETYQREKTALEGARKRCEEARTLAAAARETLDRREAEFRDLPVPTRPSEVLETELAGIVSALKALGPDVDLDALDAKRIELDAAVATTLAACQADESAAQSSDKAAALARQSLEDALQSVPLDLRDRTHLAEKQDALTRKIAEHVAALEGARRNERDTNDALIKARSGTQHAAGNKALAETQFKTVQASFAERLAEAFIAALALALGLSDVVESTRGNVRLDTIFIDEGFGSLDADGDARTLEQVLETLQDLVGQNRAVGLISHVPLVQQAIPNGFWITKTTSGSHVEMRS